MRECSAKGCKNMATEVARTPQGTFDVCIAHLAVLQDEIVERQPVIPIVTKKVTPDAIAARKAGAAASKAKPPGRPVTPLPAGTVAQIETLREEGKSLNDIAQATGVHRSTLSRRLQQGLEAAVVDMTTPSGLLAFIAEMGKKIAAGEERKRVAEQQIKEGKRELLKASQALAALLLRDEPHDV